MDQEWFTLAELRATDVGICEDHLKGLAARFERLKPRQARVRIVHGQPLHEADPEFHISVFTRYTRHKIKNKFRDRIEKLGISRPVKEPKPNDWQWLTLEEILAADLPGVPKTKTELQAFLEGKIQEAARQ